MAFRGTIHVGRMLLVGALLLVLSSSALAQDEPPPPAASGSAAGSIARPAVAPCPPNPLYCQLDFPGTSAQWISSQDFAINQFDTFAADDFAVSTAGGVRSWQISAIQVSGVYYDHFVDKQPVTNDVSVSVFIYADNNTGRPGALISQQAGVIDPGSMPGAELFISLPSQPVIGAGGHYWVSVQAVKGQGQWGWLKRTQRSNFSAVWRNPQNGLLTGCTNWTPMTSCTSGLSPDLLFGLAGTASTTTAASPVLSDITPAAGFNRNVNMLLQGYGFAPGAVVSWTVGAGPAVTFTTTFQSATQLHAVIPAAFVTPNGQQATVAVVNAAPCAGTCASNTLPFAIEPYFRQYLPAIHR